MLDEHHGRIGIAIWIIVSNYQALLGLGSETIEADEKPRGRKARARGKIDVEVESSDPVPGQRER